MVNRSRRKTRIFSYDDIILDPNVNSWAQAGAFTWNDEVATLEAVDDYTIKWTLPSPSPSMSST